MTVGAHPDEAFSIYEEALASEEPLAHLRDVVGYQLEHYEELDRETLLGRLEALRLKLREQDRHEDEDVVLEVMDFLVGWCSPHARI
jgi:hypothetical protein